MSKPSPIPPHENESAEALVNIDQAIDAMIAAVMTIEEWLPKVVPETERERKAIAEVEDLMNTAIAPYLADVAKAMNSIEED